MQRNSFIFYKSFYDALSPLPALDKAIIYESIILYSLEGILPNLEGYLLAFFTLIKPQIDANNKKYENGKKGAEHGKKGGRPSNNNPTETPKKPRHNPTETPNANANANVDKKERKKDNNIELLSKEKTNKILRGSRLPLDWELSEDDGEWAEKEFNLPFKDICIEADKFKDYWISKAGAGGIKLDWQATWRNWIRSKVERKFK